MSYINRKNFLIQPTGRPKRPETEETGETICKQKTYKNLGLLQKCLIFAI